MTWTLATATTAPPARGGRARWPGAAWLLHSEPSVQAVPQLHDTEASVLTFQAWGGSLSLAQ